MSFQRKIIYWTSIYSFVSNLNSKVNLFFFSFQISGITFIFLSILSLLSYHCIIEDVFKSTPSLYMMHLNYFKSNSCNSLVDWRALGIENVPNGIQPIRSEELIRVERTFWISFWYLSFSSYMVIASAILYCKLSCSNFYKLNYHLNIFIQ